MKKITIEQDTFNENFLVVRAFHDLGKGRVHTIQTEHFSKYDNRLPGFIQRLMSIHFGVD